MIGDILMWAALVCFFLSGACKFFDRQPALACALIFVGAANAILMTQSNKKPAPPKEPSYFREPGNAR